MVTQNLDSRDKIMRAAHDAFISEGYRCSIDKIAQLAGVAKQTVYNHFATKDALFDEVTRRNVSMFTVPLAGSAQQPREALCEFARAFRQCVLGDECMAGMRIIVAEAGRFPEMAARTYRLGPEETMQRLTEYLGKAMDLGVLRKEEPRFAADMLVGMLIGADRTALLFGAQPEPYDENARVTAIIDCFMRAYAP